MRFVDAGAPAQRCRTQGMIIFVPKGGLLSVTWLQNSAAGRFIP